MPYFADFGTFQCLILQISELSNALFYRHRERLASGRCKQRSGNPEPRERSGNALFYNFRNFSMPYFTGIASGSPVIAASSGLAIQSRESEAAMPYFADF